MTLDEWLETIPEDERDTLCVADGWKAGADGGTNQQTNNKPKGGKEVHMDMTDKETKEHLLRWVKQDHGPFAWPTDACGYEQHIKFVKHRNKNYTGGDFRQFVTDYANSLEDHHIPHRSGKVFSGLMACLDEALRGGVAMYATRAGNVVMINEKEYKRLKKAER